MNNSKTVNAAQQIINNPEYVKRWFDATELFGGFYMSGPLKTNYFITGEVFNRTKIYALREITSDGIHTVGEPQNTLEAVKELFKKVKEGK